MFYVGGMVTSLEMIEIEMGNRGSKSNILPLIYFFRRNYVHMELLEKILERVFVKEQRVDGSSVLSSIL